MSAISVSSPRWRPEDEALYQRLRDEETMATIWALHAPPGTDPLPRRAAVLLQEARQANGGSAAALLASSGHPQIFVDWLGSDEIRSWPAPLIHAAAVYFTRLATAWADALVSGARDASTSERSFIVTAVRALTLWLLLDSKGDYLVSLGREIASGALRDDALPRIAQSMVMRILATHASEATRGARDRTRVSAASLAILRRVPEACRAADVDTATVRRLAMRAESLRGTAIDAALASIQDALTEARASDAPSQVYPPLFVRVAAVWEWAERDVFVERFAIEQATTIAWDFNRRSSFRDMREMLAPCTALFDSMEARILASPSHHLGDTAPCAQILVFRSEAEVDPRKELAFGERAIRVCPTHRNGRATVAHLLANRAILLLDRATWLTARNDLAQATELVTRAEKTFADSRRAIEARAKLDEAKRRWGSAA